MAPISAGAMPASRMASAAVPAMSVSRSSSSLPNFECAQPTIAPMSCLLRYRFCAFSDTDGAAGLIALEGEVEYALQLGGAPETRLDGLAATDRVDKSLVGGGHRRAIDLAPGLRMHVLPGADF